MTLYKLVVNYRIVIYTETKIFEAMHRVTTGYVVTNKFKLFKLRYFTHMGEMGESRKGQICSPGNAKDSTMFNIIIK